MIIITILVIYEHNVFISQQTDWYDTSRVSYSILYINPLHFLVRTVASNVTRLVALTANRLFSALTSNMATLTTVAANSSIGASAGDMARLTAIQAKSLVCTVTSHVAHLTTITADDKLGGTSRTSLTRAITSKVTKSSTVKALLLSLTTFSTL